MLGGPLGNVRVKAFPVFHHRREETPLAFGKNQIERQSAFARTAHARDDDELPARDSYREVLQIVLARAVDVDRVTSLKRNFVSVKHSILLSAESSYANRSYSIINRTKLGREARFPLVLVLCNSLHTLQCAPAFPSPRFARLRPRLPARDR